MAIASSAGAFHLDNRWRVTTTGKHFTGTYTNTTDSVVNGFAVGTGLKDKNAIVSFTIAGQKCGLYAAYGSAYCYTNIAVKPGETVTFDGDTEEAVGSEGFQMCDSADRGMDNTCIDVAVSKSEAATTTLSQDDTRHLRLAVHYLDAAISAEEAAVRALKNGNPLLAEQKVSAGASAVHDAANDIYESGVDALLPAVSDAEHALHLDHQAQPLTGRGKSRAQRVRAQLLVEQALTSKHSALELVQSYHP